MPKQSAQARSCTWTNAPHERPTRRPARHLAGIVVALALLAAAAMPGVARASEIIHRNAADMKLAVNAKGEALVTYRLRGKIHRTLAWGAVNALAPTRARPQVKFRLDYAGGWGKYHRPYWKNFRNACRRYDGPELSWKIDACKAPDGSYWALQAWQRALPNFGLEPTATQDAWELRLSHWTGPLPVLEITLNWAFQGRFDHLFGRLMYLGRPVYGFRSTAAGVPLDTYGRNLYLDTYDSEYGRGWKRENSFLAHTGRGTFCYGFYPHGSRPAGKGIRYRATVIGPGVAPDVMWESPAPGDYNSEADRAANDQQRALGDPLCRQS